ncbi:MAG: tyrosine--tRNA ligase [Nitriliruptoraceae bacterium]
MTDPIAVLRERGFVQDITDEAGLRQKFAAGPVTFYVGFDPTAPSLHAGNLVGMMAMAWLQRSGHRPIALAGGATGRIGDPSGRDSERQLLDDATLQRHLTGIRAQLSALLDLDDDAGLLVDNFDWLGEVTFLGFLRDVGKHFSVNAMIARESVKRRLESREQGISYTEFSYQLLQAYDFLHLYREHACVLQGGGSDQWGNIVAGVDLIRRVAGGDAFGLTWPLLTTSDGAKFGKSAGNAVWLDPELTSSYAYYQYWMNVADADVERFLRLFTFLSLDEIAEVVRTHAQDPAARKGQTTLAREATRIIHGGDAVTAAERATAVLFSGASLQGLDDAILGEVFAEAPSVTIPRKQLDTGIGILTLMTHAGAAKSNGEARRLIAQGAVQCDNLPVDDPEYTLDGTSLFGRSTVVLKVGKKRYFLARFE